MLWIYIHKCIYFFAFMFSFNVQQKKIKNIYIYKKKIKKNSLFIYIEQIVSFSCYDNKTRGVV